MGMDWQGGQVGPWEQGQFGESSEYGGQQMFGDPNAADYGSVQGYADAAHENARRYLDPQQAQQDRRFDQDLINQGIDPMSDQGKERKNMLMMQQGDQDAAASFQAMQFGQGIQNQMSQQEQAKAQLAGQMQQGLWGNQLGAQGQGLQYALGQGQLGQGLLGLQSQHGLGQSGQDLQRYLGELGAGNQLYGMQSQFNLGRGQQDVSRYGMQLQNQLGMGGLDMARQGQDFNQMMGLEGVDFRNRQYADQGQQYQDQLMMALMGMTPVPGVNPISPNQGNNQYADPGLLGRLGI